MSKNTPKENPNINNQLAYAKTYVKSTTHRFAKIWVVDCQECQTRYGVNGCDFHIRRCPNCQDGKEGEPIPSSETWKLI